MTPFSKFLKSHRKRTGLLQKQIALTLGVSPAYVCCWETGTKPPPCNRQLRTLADVLRLDEREFRELSQLAEQSRPTLRLPVDTPEAGYQLAHRLVARLPAMSERQIFALSSVLEL